MCNGAKLKKKAILLVCMGGTSIALIFGSQVYLDLKMINHEFQLVMPLPHVSSQIATSDDVEFTPDISAFPVLTSLL